MRIITINDSLRVRSMSLFHRVIRYGFVTSQLITVFCQFSSSILSLSTKNNDSSKEDTNWSLDLLSFSIALIFALIAAYTAYKFQGRKIIENTGQEDQEEKNLLPVVTKRTTKSNLAELGYISFTSFLILLNNYFTIMAFKTWIEILDGDKPEHTIVPLNGLETLLVVLLTLMVDIPFNATNAMCAASEEIKKSITGSEANALIYKMINPMTNNKISTFWITRIGALSHTLNHTLGMLLCLPPKFILNAAKKPFSFFLFIVGSGILIFSLNTINFFQTYLFEGKESERNLKKVADNDKTSLNTENKKIQLPRWRYILFRNALYTQGPLHGFCDMMPVIFFLQRLLVHSSVKIGVTISTATFQFLASSLGNHFSEVKSAMNEIEKKFEVFATLPNV